jgi:protein SCO1
MRPELCIPNHSRAEGLAVRASVLECGNGAESAERSYRFRQPPTSRAVLPWRALVESGDFALSSIAALQDAGAPSRSPTVAKELFRLVRSLFILIAFLVSTSLPSQSQTLSDATLARIDFEQKLNAQVTPELRFVDEEGRALTLGSYFGHTPVIVVLGYYECPMLCSLVLNGLIEGLQQIKWSIGRDFEVVCVSINPRETPALASAKKRTYLRRYGREGAAQGWHFLIGGEPSIRQLADEVGFQYAYDPASRQYAHPSGVVILTSTGRISGYQLGVTFPGQPLYATLAQASAQKIGSPVERLILLCFHYNPITGKYGVAIITAVRVLGLATLIGLAALIVGLTRRASVRARAWAARP